MHPDGKLFGPQERPLWTGFPVPTNATFIYLAPFVLSPTSLKACRDLSSEPVVSSLCSILGPDQAPVALVVAYTCSPAQEFLEPECQFLQAVAGIVLSALLMRRVQVRPLSFDHLSLALGPLTDLTTHHQEGDKIKAQFISNVSHELRT